MKKSMNDKHFSIDYNLIINTLKQNNFSIIYNKNILYLIRSKTYFNFDLNLLTHRKLILKKDDKNN